MIGESPQQRPLQAYGRRHAGSGMRRPLRGNWPKQWDAPVPENLVVDGVQVQVDGVDVVVSYP